MLVGFFLLFRFNIVGDSYGRTRDLFNTRLMYQRNIKMKLGLIITIINNLTKDKAQ
jgi:hypothetical protein